MRCRVRMESRLWARRGQVTLVLPAALSHQQPLEWVRSHRCNVLHEAPSLAPPLPPFLNLLGAAVPGLEERGKTPGERGCEGRVEGGRSRHSGGMGATVGLLADTSTILARKN